MKKICEFCRSVFVIKGSHKNTRFCSIACANKSRRKNFEKKCEYCSSLFRPPRSHPNQKYCSMECRDMAKTKTIVRNCSMCGKEIKVKYSRALKTEHSFCSRKCNTRWKIIHTPSGENHPQYVERISITCENCGKPVLRLKGNIKKHNFCSVDCRRIWQKTSGYMQGEKSPTWLGGYDDYRGPNWEKMRKEALIRDNYTCQNPECGSKINVGVHHKQPYITFDSYIEANKLENLISLCNKCHTKAEWEYRKQHPEMIRFSNAPKYRLHICKKCGEEYIVSNRSSRSLYCDKCRIGICEKCGKEFYIKSFREKNKYCSRKCAGTSK